MSEPFLILHRVRSEPAFDIAEQRTFEDGEEYWIIPTSGHRAYPYWSTQLIYNDSLGKCYCSIPTNIWNVANMPTDWPDHYSCNDRSSREAPTTLASRAKGLLESLGLMKKIEIERRD